jgi:phosphocarrier protein HPr
MQNKTLQAEIKIVNRLGLHARAAAQLVKLAGKFKSEIILRRTDNGNSANAKSILNVLTLAASQGTILTAEVTGEDAEEALSAVKEIFLNGFGEL